MKCSICNRLLNQANDSFSVDCGGDCLLCMAKAGDTGCALAVAEVAQATLDAAVAEAVAAERALWQADAERYRWLRDISVPPHNFYLSVPVEFDGVRYAPAEVDAYIDAAIRRTAQETP